MTIQSSEARSANDVSSVSSTRYQGNKLYCGSKVSGYTPKIGVLIGQV